MSERPTRPPLPPPFAIGARVRYRGTQRVLTGTGDRALLEPGMEVEITGTSPGRRGTGRQFIDRDGPMVDDDGEPIVDRTKDGHSVYLVDDGTRLRGRIIWPADAGDWEVLGEP